MNEKLLVALLGAVPGMLVPILAWIQQRSRQARNEKCLERAMKELELIERLLEVHAKHGMGGAAEMISGKLREKLASLAEECIGQVGERLALTIPHEPRSLVRRGLLLYFPQSLGGWLLHIPFYMILGSWISLWLAFLWKVLDGSYVFEKLPNLLLIQFAAAVVMVLLQRFGSRLDRQMQSS
jgi:hypothetical protein